MNEPTESESEMSVPETSAPGYLVPATPEPPAPVSEGRNPAGPLPDEEPPIERHDPFAWMRGAPWMNRKLSPSGRAAAFARREFKAFPVIEGRDPNGADLDAIVKRTVDYMVPIFKREQATDYAYDVLEEKRQARIAERQKNLHLASLPENDGKEIQLAQAVADQPPSDGDQMAQQRPQTRQPSTPKPPPSKTVRQPGRVPEKSGEQITRETEARREAALSSALPATRREERARRWDEMLRQLPIPTPPGSRIQAPLPQDWRGAINKIDPRYVKFTEDAARKHGVPAELLARVLYRESNYKNENNDGARGIPQMREGALTDVGLDPKTFGSIGAEKQIDAGAAYLAKQYRALRDWPKAVAAYHLGAKAIQDWHAGKGPGSDSVANDPDVVMNPGNAEKRKAAKDSLDRWRGLETYLPYIFLGDPNRYGGGETR